MAMITVAIKMTWGSNIAGKRFLAAVQQVRRRLEMKHYRIAALCNKCFSMAHDLGIVPIVDANGGFLLPVPPHQLFPSGGFSLHISWAAVSDGPFFCPPRHNETDDL